jgi:hypothetical protein
MHTVQIDVYYPVPEGWGVCNTCEMMMAQAGLGKAPYERGLDEYPPEWQAEFKRLAAMIFTLADRYQDSVQIRIWDPRSLQGLWRSIRYGIRHYPTFIVSGQGKMTGWDMVELDRHIQTAVET